MQVYVWHQFSLCGAERLSSWNVVHFAANFVCECVYGPTSFPGSPSLAPWDVKWRDLGNEVGRTFDRIVICFYLNSMYELWRLIPTIHKIFMRRFLLVRNHLFNYFCFQSTITCTFDLNLEARVLRVGVYYNTMYFGLVATDFSWFSHRMVRF